MGCLGPVGERHLGEGSSVVAGSVEDTNHPRAHDGPVDLTSGKEAELNNICVTNCTGVVRRVGGTECGALDSGYVYDRFW